VVGEGQETTLVHKPGAYSRRQLSSPRGAVVGDVLGPAVEETELLVVQRPGDDDLDRWVMADADEARLVLRSAHEPHG
jgi:hypothetical protein